LYVSIKSGFAPLFNVGGQFIIGDIAVDKKRGNGRKY